MRYTYSLSLLGFLLLSCSFSWRSLKFLRRSSSSSRFDLSLSSCSDKNTKNAIIVVNGHTIARIVVSDIVIYLNSKNNLKYVYM